MAEMTQHLFLRSEHATKTDIGQTNTVQMEGHPLEPEALRNRDAPMSILEVKTRTKIKDQGGRQKI